jgi:Tol biopolymer transport system component
MKRCHTKLLLQERTFLPLIASSLLIASLLVGCQDEKDRNGITFIAPRGDPPAQLIVWSPVENDEILVTAGNMGPGGEVYIFDLETKKKTTLAKTDGGSFEEAVWTPDGQDIYIVSGDNTQGFEPRGWWKMDISNGSSEYLMDLGRVVAQWSPDGKTIVTAIGKDLFLKEISTGTEDVIHTSIEPIYAFDLSWSPDGQYLAFPAGESPSKDLYVTHIETQQITRLTENETTGDTAWSPTSNIIAFVTSSNVSGKKTLHLVSSDGKCRVNIPTVNFASSPTWSPDGRKLGYVGIDGIYSLDISNSLGRNISEGLCD